MGDTRSLRFAAFAAIAALAGCAETQLGAQLAKDVAREDAPAAATQRELAPESFEANGLTIWDGQTTLQGIWVAHPLAQKAQRVRVINSENGLEVEGAMFRRDPTLSGPSILVSSDAARGLGLQPGRPTELRLVALKEGVYRSPTTGQASATPAVETAALPAVEETGEAQASEGEVTFVPAPEDNVAANSPPPEPPASEPAVAPEDVAVSATEEVDRSVAAQPETAVDAEITAPDAAADTDASEPVQAVEETEVAEAPSPEPPAEPEVKAAAAEAPQPETGPYRGELPKGLFVQAGAFGVELNAQALVAKMRTIGLPAQYVRRGTTEKPLNIVMIGPLPDEPTVIQAIKEAADAGAPGGRRVKR